MSLGVSEAAIAKGYKPHSSFALDSDHDAAAVFAANFPRARIECGQVQDYFAATETAQPTREEQRLRDSVGNLDLIVGGPPCQGNSDLNNFSRRNDARNQLYSYMARAAIILSPTHMIVENVQGIPHDKSGVLQHTIAILERAGYQTESILLNTAEFGVSQKRRRHVLVASKNSLAGLTDQIARFRLPFRGAAWAFGDLENIARERIFDQSSRPSRDNAGRIDYLFEHDIYDLPNSERPPCHRDRAQTYNSVYGRMSWDNPAQTVTSGFYSTCMGRYVHPSQRRTLTAHEAARLQFIPDFFSFDAVKSRTSLAKIIGNAVPPKLSYVLTSALLNLVR
jgi:DNA (cytosine-5)-methyltransferase 1